MPHLQMTSCKASGLQMSKSDCTLVELVQMQLSHGNGGGKALFEEDGAVPESRNLCSRNTANCQCVEMILIQNILLQVFVKHHIGVNIN